MIRIINDPNQKAQITRNILESLPEYFGIPRAIDMYVSAVCSMPFFVIEVKRNPIAFIAIKIHHQKNAEIYVMAVNREYHRKGLGKQLIDGVKTYCYDHAIQYLTVKTLDATHPDNHYQKTRAFYQKMGFEPLETLPTLWDEKNPCLYSIMIL